MTFLKILKEGVRMVLPKWLRPKSGPTMKDLRQQVQEAKAEIEKHRSEIFERVQVRKGRTMELGPPPVTNGSHQ